MITTEKNLHEMYLASNLDFAMLTVLEKNNRGVSKPNIGSALYSQLGMFPNTEDMDQQAISLQYRKLIEEDNGIRYVFDSNVGSGVSPSRDKNFIISPYGMDYLKKVRFVKSGNTFSGEDSEMATIKRELFRRNAGEIVLRALQDSPIADVHGLADIKHNAYSYGTFVFASASSALDKHVNNRLVDKATDDGGAVYSINQAGVSMLKLLADTRMHIDRRLGLTQ